MLLVVPVLVALFRVDVERRRDRRRPRDRVGLRRARDGDRQGRRAARRARGCGSALAGPRAGAAVAARLAAAWPARPFAALALAPRRVRPVPRRRRPEPGDPDRARRAAGHAGAAASCSTRGRRASSGSRRRSARRRSPPTSRCATGSTTRAATTSRSSAATTGSGATQVTDDEDGFAPPTLLAATTEPALRALGLLGVARHHAAARASRRSRACRRPTTGPDARIYANPHAVPRAWWVGGQRVVPSEAAQLAAIAEPGFDPRREAIVGEPVEGLPETPAEPGGRVRIARLRARPGRADRELARPRPRRALRRALPGLEARRSTAARCRSSASTTCCAGSRSAPASTASS